jgi:hypothetical protein
MTVMGNGGRVTDDMENVGRTWELDDAERRHRDSPRSFFIPTRAEREALRPGDRVKLLFALEDPRAGGGFQVERMWVEVEAVVGERYRGRLVNDPVTPHRLARGAAVTFGPEHVAGRAVEPESLGYDADAKIFVSARALVRDEPPRRLHYSPPSDARDSGWEAFAGDETQEYLDDPHNCRAIALGWFAERHPEIERALRDPRSGWWDWDPERAVYVPVGE